MLRRADGIVLTRCDQTAPDTVSALHQRIARLAPHVCVVEAVHSPVELVNGDAHEELSLLRQHPVAGFCGLGNPRGFSQTLVTLGARVLEFRAFPDHHAYTREDVDWLRAWAQQQPEDALLVTTQKDLVKLRLRELGGRPLWALRIRLTFRAGQSELDALLERVLPR